MTKPIEKKVLCKVSAMRSNNNNNKLNRKCCSKIERTCIRKTQVQHLELEEVKEHHNRNQHRVKNQNKDLSRNRLRSILKKGCHFNHLTVSKNQVVIKTFLFLIT